MTLPWLLHSHLPAVRGGTTVVAEQPQPRLTQIKGVLVTRCVVFPHPPLVLEPWCHPLGFLFLACSPCPSPHTPVPFASPSPVFLSSPTVLV